MTPPALTWAKTDTRAPLIVHSLTQSVPASICEIQRAELAIRSELPGRHGDGAEVMAYFDDDPARYGISNGGTEAIALIIENARPLANGFRNFGNYRILVAADRTRPWRRRQRGQGELHTRRSGIGRPPTPLHLAPAQPTKVVRAEITTAVLACRTLCSAPKVEHDDKDDKLA